MNCIDWLWYSLSHVSAPRPTLDLSSTASHALPHSIPKWKDVAQSTSALFTQAHLGNLDIIMELFSWAWQLR